METPQRDAWLSQIALLVKRAKVFVGRGSIYFEYVVPRLGRRIDVVLLVDHVLFVLEFKVGATAFQAAAVEQVWDYALDLKNFHETSHAISIAPILIATKARDTFSSAPLAMASDGVFTPLCLSPNELTSAIDKTLAFSNGDKLSAADWETGRYKPTPPIIEAATALYSDYSVVDLADSGAEDVDLRHSEAGWERAGLQSPSIEPTDVDCDKGLYVG